MLTQRRGMGEPSAIRHTQRKKHHKTPPLPLSRKNGSTMDVIHALWDAMARQNPLPRAVLPRLTRRGVESPATARHTQIGCTSHRRGSFIPPRGTFVTCVRGVWGAAAAARAGSSAEMRGVEKHPPNPPNHGSRRARTAAAGWLIVERHHM